LRVEIFDFRQRLNDSSFSERAIGGFFWPMAAPLLLAAPMQGRLITDTQGPGLYEITGGISGWLDQIGAASGLLTLFIRHSSASLLVQENADPQVRTDLTAFLHRLVPPSDDPAMAYLTHIQEGPDDMPAHIKAALLPVHLSIPVAKGRMALGTWQGIYVVEHRMHPHRRQIALHFRAD